MSYDLQEVHRIVDKAVLHMVIEFNTYAQFLMKIGYTYKDLGDALACTDGKTIYINDKAIAEMNEKNDKELGCVGKEEMVFIICHEIMHLFTATFDRAESLGIPKKIYNGDTENMRKQQLWNMATDYAINYILVNNKSAGYANKPVGKILPLALYDEKYKDMPAEEIYHILEEMSQDQIDELLGKKELRLDIHLTIDDDLVKSNLYEKIIDVFGSTDNGHSDLSIDRFAKETIKPLPFNWRKALSRYIKSYVKENYSWNKPSRVGIANNLILPSYSTSPSLHVAVALDTSASMSNNELQTALNHMATIISSFDKFKMDVWCCGTIVYKESFTTYTKQNRKQIQDFKIMSDGGNHLTKNFEFIEEHYKTGFPNVFVVLTDGYDEIDGNETLTCPCPVVWLIIDHPRFTPPRKMKSVVFPYVVDKGKNAMGR